MEDFAESLIRNVRDPAMRNLRFEANAEIKTSGGRRWTEIRTRQQGLHSEDIDFVVASCVDVCIFYLLDAIDAGRLSLFWDRDDGSGMLDLTEASGGEAPGWFIADDESWRDAYASEPHFPQ